MLPGRDKAALGPTLNSGDVLMAERARQIGGTSELPNNALRLRHVGLIRSKRIRRQRGKRIEAGDIFHVMKKPVTNQLKELRDRAGISMEALAKAAGYKGASSYQRYEDPALFTKEYLPLDLVEAIAPSLVGKGTPPITADEVYTLARAIPPGAPPEIQEIEREMQMVPRERQRAVWDAMLSVVRSHKVKLEP